MHILPIAASILRTTQNKHDLANIHVATHARVCRDMHASTAMSRSTPRAVHMETGIVSVMHAQQLNETRSD